MLAIMTPSARGVTYHTAAAQHGHARQRAAYLLQTFWGNSVQARRRPGKRLYAADSSAAGMTAGGSAASQRVLIISPLWPEPSSSAAGVRTIRLVEAFLSWGWEVSYLSPSRRNDFSEKLDGRGVSTFSVKPNRRKELEAVLRDVNPTVCMFDRFFAEEAFSFVVRSAAPEALRILDTQDLHFLRNGRQDTLKAALKGRVFHSLMDIIAHIPNAESPAFLRELAALHRSDLNVMCSPVEIEMLKEQYNFPTSKLALSSFLCEATTFSATPTFGERAHFMTIGNFKHPPNMDSVRWLASELWDDIRKALELQGQQAELHIYGAYPSQEAMQLDQPHRGLRVMGHAPSLDIMRGYRVCLAPIRFGAGLKGKVLDSWAHGLPVCTTPIGAEGLFRSGFPVGGDLTSWIDGGEVKAARRAVESGGKCQWGGTWAATTAEEVVSDAVTLYNNEAMWTECQAEGNRIMTSLFSAEENKAALRRDILAALNEVQSNRRKDFIGSMLWYQGNRSTEYFSRWIELKETMSATVPSESADSAQIS